MTRVNMTSEERRRNRDFPPPPLPEDFSVRLGRLEDRSGDSLEEFARRWILPMERAREWRCGELPNTFELRAMMEWACSVSGGVAVLLSDCSHPWPVGGGSADGRSPRPEWSPRRGSQTKQEGRAGLTARPSCFSVVAVSFLYLLTTPWGSHLAARWLRA